MCLLGIALRQFDDWPILVLANREEAYSRPSAGPQVFPRQGDRPAWMGGVDLTAGGTWLGVNEFGLLIAVTNRKKSAPPANPPSRGILCRSLLASADAPGAIAEALCELEGNSYAGCNLLIADCSSAFVVEAGDVLISTRLENGLHLIANGALNAADDLRIQRARRELSDDIPPDTDTWFREAMRVCRLRAEGTEPPILLAGADHGTVSSTVLGIASHLEHSRFWYSPGPPDKTPYGDCTPLLRQLLTGQAFQADSPPDIEPPDNSPARRAIRQNLDAGIRLHVPDAPENAPYRIFLRGPWQCEPLARAERDANGGIAWSTSPLPAPSTVRLPATWKDLFGSFRGRIRFRRRFHRPTNLEPEDRVYLAFDGIGGAAAISTNGCLLGAVPAHGGTAQFDITDVLTNENELLVDLEFTALAGVPDAGGLYAAVALEIHHAG